MQALGQMPPAYLGLLREDAKIPAVHFAEIHQLAVQRAAAASAAAGYAS